MKKLVAILLLMSAGFIGMPDWFGTQNELYAQSTDNPYSVDAFYAAAEGLEKDTVFVAGVIEHVCIHSQRRCKIKGAEHELKIELSEALPSFEEDAVGESLIVKGEVVLTELDLEAVEGWEKRIRQVHAGEEETEHFREEIVALEKIKKQFESGEISSYPVYSIHAIEYQVVSE